MIIPEPHPYAAAVEAITESLFYIDNSSPNESPDYFIYMANGLSKLFTEISAAGLPPLHLDGGFDPVTTHSWNYRGKTLEYDTGVLIQGLRMPITSHVRMSYEQTSGHFIGDVTDGRFIDLQDIGTVLRSLGGISVETFAEPELG